MTIHSTKSWRILAVLLILPVLTLSLAAQRGNNSLTVVGQPGTARVIQVGGRNYVDVEGLARITNGSIRFSGNQIVLTLPDSGSDAVAAMNYIDPNALENDPLDQKIRGCGHAQASIATSNQFTDDGSCQ